MISRFWLLAAGAVVLAAGGYVATTPGPDLLSLADGMMGGGRGTERVRAGAPYGTHGQRLDVWRPSAASVRPRPVIVFFYGGGWVAGTRTGYAFAGRALASRGFLVVIPDYRKVPRARFPAFLEDGAEAIRWAQDHAAELGGDPRRIAVAGHSAGGWIAAMLALDQRWLRAAGVAPGTIRAAVGLSGPYDFYPWDSRRAIDALANWPDPHATQPVTFARVDAPPMLLVTSTEDTTVKPRNAYRLARKLHALGATVELRDYPGLSHENVAMALARPFRGKGRVLDDMTAFLRREMP